MNKTEGEILADAYESVRGLTKFYLSKIDKIDINKSIVTDGITFNSAYWILAHLVWTEHSLLIEGLGREMKNIPWLEEYGFGSNPSEAKQKPPVEEILQKMDEVHEAAISNIKKISDKEMDEPNSINASFGGVNSKRNIIKHAIRHEPMHMGQLSWILKAQGVKMV